MISIYSPVAETREAPNDKSIYSPLAATREASDDKSIFTCSRGKGSTK